MWPGMLFPNSSGNKAAADLSLRFTELHIAAETNAQQIKSRSSQPKQGQNGKKPFYSLRSNL